MTQNKNDSINSILQHGRVVDNNCCVVFSTSRFPYLMLWPNSANGIIKIFLSMKISCC